MRIVVNDIAASSGGALSILRSLHEYLISSQISKEHEWIFLLSGKYIQESDNIKVVVLDKAKKWSNRLKFDLYLGNKYIPELKPDIVVSMQNTIIFGLKCPQILYMHQPLPFQNEKKFSFLKSEERKLAIYQYIIGYLIKLSIKKADFTIVQTKWVRDAVIKSTNVPSRKIINILPPIEDYSKYKKDGLFDNHKFFYPASNILYKNHKCIYDACAILNEKGITEYNVSLTIDDKENGNIKYLGNIPYDSVMQTYNESTLIFPSYIETLGLPLQEARQLGTIILAADCKFSREILEGYENTHYFDPFKPGELADLMEKVINKVIIRKQISTSPSIEESSWYKFQALINNIININ